MNEVVGEGPNLAARLQALAVPDSVLIASTRAASHSPWMSMRSISGASSLI
jgi:class 3 adenylate cyclase